MKSSRSSSIFRYTLLWDLLWEQSSQFTSVISSSDYFHRSLPKITRTQLIGLIGVQVERLHQSFLHQLLQVEKYYTVICAFHSYRTVRSLNLRLSFQLQIVTRAIFHRDFVSNISESCGWQCSSPKTKRTCQFFLAESFRKSPNLLQNMPPLLNCFLLGAGSHQVIHLRGVRKILFIDAGGLQFKFTRALRPF